MNKLVGRDSQVWWPRVGFMVDVSLLLDGIKQNNKCHMTYEADNHDNHDSHDNLIEAKRI